MKKEKERQTQLDDIDYDLERLDPYGDSNDNVELNNSIGGEMDKKAGTDKSEGLLKQFQQIVKKK